MQTSRIHLMGIQSGLISAVKGLYNCVPSSIKDSNKLMFFLHYSKNQENQKLS